MSIKIVFADDHRMFRQSMKFLLEARGNYHVAEASDGEEALKQVRQLRPHLVLMDICMPGKNGIETTARIKQEFPEVKVLGLSSCMDITSISSMFEAGVSGFTMKEGEVDELMKAITSVLQGDMYLSPNLSSLVLEDYADFLSGKKVFREPEISVREREVLQLIAEGFSTKEAAAELSISIKTVETHRKNMMDKLKLRSIAGLTKYAIQQGITSLDDSRPIRSRETAPADALCLISHRS
ncbi:MAG: response regulator transcription factor [Verrucomicrobiota bacterium]